MDKIIVCDNFFNLEEISKILTIIKENKWEWGHKSNGEKLSETPFWTMDLSEDLFFSNTLKKIIEKHFGKKFNLNRVYANGQTFGQDGTFHTDDENPKAVTFCFYANHISEEYVDTAGGYIYFKIPGKKFEVCYQPIFNRGIMFPSSFMHKGVSYTRYIMDMRICIAWKLVEI
jgi:hypothetical protein